MTLDMSVQDTLIRTNGSMVSNEGFGNFPGFGVKQTWFLHQCYFPGLSFLTWKTR